MTSAAGWSRLGNRNKGLGRWPEGQLYPCWTWQRVFQARAKARSETQN